MTYNPFRQSFGDLVVADLGQLRQVAEGWYVEYKSTKVPTKSIAKSLAAFANHYGGWLFYGVESARDGSNFAEAFPGLDKPDTSSLIESLRNAAKDLLNPTPVYEHRVFDGPCPDIGLPADRAIVVVAIPQGMNTPYIHGDGKIYRRVADASDPRAETDRFILDQLWERKRSAQKVLKRLLRQRPIISEAEKDQPLFQLFYLQDPMNQVYEESRLSFDTFVDVMAKARPGFEGLSIAFDNFFSTSDGFVARHVHKNDPYGLVMTWKHLNDGSSIISAPLRRYGCTPGVASEALRGYKYVDQYADLAHVQRYESLNILDVQFVIVLVASCISQHRLLLQERDLRGSTYAKLSFDNIWRTTPYLDTPSFVQFVATCGMPLIQSDSETAPPETTIESMVVIDDFDDDQEMSLAAKQILQVLPLLDAASAALGIPSDVVFDKDDEWFAAVTRSLPILRGYPVEVSES